MLNQEQIDKAMGKVKPRVYAMVGDLYVQDVSPYYDNFALTKKSENAGTRLDKSEQKWLSINVPGVKFYVMKELVTQESFTPSFPKENDCE